MLWVKVFTLDCLLAGKVHAALFRAWRNRVKGRDWYDLEWYIRNGVACNLRHLAERTKATSHESDLSSSEAVIEAFRSRIDSIDFELAKSDVRPFLKDVSSLNIWSREYFKALVGQMKFV